MYKIRVYSKFRDIYPNMDDVILYKDNNEYEEIKDSSIEKILADVLDVPSKKLTEEQVRKDFETPSMPPISDENVNSITSYYNRRKDLYDEIVGHIKNGYFETNPVRRYDMMKMSSFYVYPDKDDKIEVLESYVELTHVKEGC